MAKRSRKKSINTTVAVGAIQKILSFEDEGFAPRHITIVTLVEYFKQHAIKDEPDALKVAVEAQIEK
jgi:hypothetical protein